MSIGMTKLTMLAVVIVAITSLTVGVSTIIEQDVKAQNMTTNMTESSGNSTGTEDGGSGSISRYA
jgi:hypothetical protein